MTFDAVSLIRIDGTHWSFKSQVFETEKVCQLNTKKKNVKITMMSVFNIH